MSFHPEVKIDMPAYSINNKLSHTSLLFILYVPILTLDLSTYRIPSTSTFQVMLRTNLVLALHMVQHTKFHPPDLNFWLHFILFYISILP